MNPPLWAWLLMAPVMLEIMLLDVDLFPAPPREYKAGEMIVPNRRIIEMVKAQK